MRKNDRVLLLAAFFAVQAASAICEEDVAYSSGGKRDPFVPLVGVVSSAPTSGLVGVASIEDLTLQGIVVNPDGSKAVIINGEVIREGETVGNLSVDEVSGNDVTLRLNDKTHKLLLYREKKEEEHVYRKGT